MNLWKKAVAALKKRGYTGDENDLNAVKAFIDEHNFEIDGFDADVEHKKATATKLVVESDEDVDGEVEVTLKKSEVEALRQTLKAQATAHKSGDKLSKANTEGDQRFQSPKAWGNMMERKAYNAKAARGETSFSDADVAEVYGAAVRKAMMGELEYPGKSRDMDIIQKSGLTNQYALGGFTIPEAFQPDLIRLRERYGAFRKILGGYFPMSDGSVRIPRRTGGATVYAPGEGQTITDSDPTGDSISLNAIEMFALSKVSLTLLQDSAINYGNFVADEQAYALEKKIDEIAIYGDGSSTYFNQRGINQKFRDIVTAAGGTWTTAASTNADYASSVEFAGGSAWSNIELADMLNVFSKTASLDIPQSEAGICSKQFLWQVLLKLGYQPGASATTAGATFSEVMRGVQSEVFAGVPLVITNAMPRVSAGAQIPFLFGDFRLAMHIGEVQGSMQVATSDQRYFEQGLIAIRTRTRMAFNVHDVGTASSTAASRTGFGPIAALVTT